MTAYEDLPQGMRDQVEKSLREGVGLQFDLGAPGELISWKDRKLLKICWHPGDPNKLASVIIERVHERTELLLDGHRYWIEPQEQGR